MAQVEVITGPERRRRWSEDQKREIVAAGFAPGAVVREVARRAEVSPGQIYRWRQELRAPASGFAQVLIASSEGPDQGTREPTCGEPAIEVELAGKARVRIPASIPVDLASAVIKALARRLGHLERGTFQRIPSALVSLATAEPRSGPN